MVEKNIKVSIIIINYNSFELLRNCLKSIYRFHQDFEFEIIVVDNASTEGDVENVTSNFENIYLIKNKINLGFAAANNRGIKLAKGKYILFLNNDTVFIENSLEIIFNYCENLDYNFFLGCRLLNKDRSNQDSVVDFDSVLNLIGENFFLYKIFPHFSLFNKYNKNMYDSSDPLDVDIIKGAFMFCPAKEIKNLNGFDERFFFYAEETDLCYRFKKAGGRVIFFPGTSVIHLGRATSMKNLWFKFRNQSIAKIKFYQKHFAGLKFLLALLIHYLGIVIRIPVYFCIGIISLSKFNFFKSYYYLRTLFIYPTNNFKIS